MDQELPPLLAARCQWLHAPHCTTHQPGEFVLYWMHNAMRVHENPALAVAATLARQNGLPLLVYHGLSEKYPFASDRHHAFMLQGAREVQREMNAMGISYAFHLERDGNRGPHLRDLTRRAAVLVTETMPVAPLIQWTERLRSITTPPMVSVDTTCLLPISLLNQLATGVAEDHHQAEIDRPLDVAALHEHVCHAARYRDLTAASYQQRLDALCQASDALFAHSLRQSTRDASWRTNAELTSDPLHVSPDSLERHTKREGSLNSRTAHSLDLDHDADDADELAIENGFPEPFEGSLGFEPLDLQDVCLAKLIAQCRIDHTIAPVPDSPGGSIAGYARWEEFRKEGLQQYDRRRRNAEDMQCGSRLSAYLHYGMISPFRIAREASQAGRELTRDTPVKKFLDEFLIWREMSFHFCTLHADQLDTLSACPAWARDSLQEHAGDEREAVYDWETLARGKTKAPLWNAAQRSLLRHGELPNDLRMTWGKEFLTMTPCPEKSLCYLIDLNHRYALDGRSAASYGGMLWCFGQFDRPFQSESPVFGVVRPKRIQEHAKRLSAATFSLRSDRPIAAKLPRVAVIGAGMGGLMAARTMADHGLDVRVFEKSQSVGGRLATRRHETLSFDHGAQYFTVRDDRFARYVRSWIEAGHAEVWRGRIVELRPGGEIVPEKRARVRYVGTPGMDSIAQHLAQDLNVSLGCHVSRIAAAGDAWNLIDDQDQVLGSFDAVIVNCPPLQSAPLLAEHTGFASLIAEVEMIPCWTLMLQCEGIADLPFSGAFINEGPLRWVAREDDKPGRMSPHSASQSRWVLHASADWSRVHLDADEQQVTQHLIQALEQSLGQKIGHIEHAVTHLWRDANTRDALPQSCLWDSSAMLGACGDWCDGPRVEGAFLSGAAIAGTVLRQVTIDRAAAPTLVG